MSGASAKRAPAPPALKASLLLEKIHLLAQEMQTEGSAEERIALRKRMEELFSSYMKFYCPPQTERRFRPPPGEQKL